MIHLARPTLSPVANIVFSLCFVLLDFEKWGRTDDMCKNNDPYRPWLWVGRVDQYDTSERPKSQRNIKENINVYANLKVSQLL